ncbi:putative WAT1-related protein [Sesbania bispinosa]|nr:putative WAT1-related protein [Sesbania bispinosa]
MTRSRYCYKEVAPFSTLVIVQFTEVYVNILFKKATMKGLSYYVFILYSLALSTLILLLPFPFIFLILREAHDESELQGVEEKREGKMMGGFMGSGCFIVRGEKRVGEKEGMGEKEGK